MWFDSEISDQKKNPYEWVNATTPPPFDVSGSRAILVLAQGFLVFVLFETVLDFFSRPVFDLFILDSIWKLKGKRQIVALLLPDLRSMSDRLKMGSLNLFS